MLNDNVSVLGSMPLSLHLLYKKRLLLIKTFEEMDNLLKVQQLTMDPDLFKVQRNMHLTETNRQATEVQHHRGHAVQLIHSNDKS